MAEGRGHGVGGVGRTWREQNSAVYRVYG